MDKQYRHILVPLDGSELAELALVDAFYLARLSLAELTLLQVIPPIEHVIGDNDHPIFIDQQWEAQKAEVLRYLDDVCQRMGCENVKMNPAVKIGSAAEAIIDYANDHPFGLIVMATHGRSGLERLVYGSVAEKVLHGASLPILLVRAYPKRNVA